MTVRMLRALAVVACTLALTTIDAHAATLGHLPIAPCTGDTCRYEIRYDRWLLIRGNSDGCHSDYAVRHSIWVKKASRTRFWLSKIGMTYYNHMPSVLKGSNMIFQPSSGSRIDFNDSSSVYHQARPGKSSGSKTRKVGRWIYGNGTGLGITLEGMANVGFPHSCTTIVAGGGWYVYGGR